MRTRILRPLFWRALNFLPQSVRSEIIRRSFPVTHDLPDGLIFKIAETKEELEEAFQLVYQEFIATRYITENPAGLRLTKYHALPGTTVLIGKWNNEIVCTLSVIHDNPMGLPSDETWDLSEMRKNSSRVAEISGLAIKRSAQGRRGKLLLPLCKFMYEYAVNYAGVEVIVVATQAVVMEFYRAILLFKPIGDGEPVPHGFVRNFPSTAQFLDLRSAPSEYQSAYDHRSDDFNIYKYFVQTKFDCFHFPTKIHGQCVYPVMNLELLEYFFAKRISIFSGLSEGEKLAIRAAYETRNEEALDQAAKLNSIIGLQSKAKSARREPRMPTYLDATLVDTQSNTIQRARVVAASQSGLMIKLNEKIPLNQVTFIHLVLGANRPMRLEARAIWGDEQLRYGFQILRVSSQEWHEFIHLLSECSAPQTDTPLQRRLKYNQ